MSAASDLADAIWTCMEARQEERDARASAAVPDSWDYFGHSYFAAIERADSALADALSAALVVAARAAADGTP